jgi:HEAT repeat protein
MFLGWVEAKPAIPALLQVAAADRDLRVRKSALQALENIRDQGAVLPLIRLLHDDSKDIRDKVRLALERITGEMLPALSDGDDVNDRLADVNRLKEWWIKKKHEFTNGPETPAPEAAAEAAEARETGRQEVAVPIRLPEEQGVGFEGIK